MGAAVVVEGTSKGTLTDLDGLWSLDAIAPDQRIEISLLGYKTLVVEVSKASVVILEEDALFLEDAVVVGYGVQKKSVVTASIAKVSSEDLGKAAPIRVDNALKDLPPE